MIARVPCPPAVAVAVGVSLSAVYRSMLRRRRQGLDGVREGPHLGHGRHSDARGWLASAQQHGCHIAFKGC